MLAERLKTMLGRLYHTEDESFHVVLFLLCDLHVNNVSGHCKLYKKHRSVNLCQSFTFCCNCLYYNIFQNDFLLLSCHICFNK